MRGFIVLLALGCMCCSATAAVSGTRVRAPATIDTSVLTGGDAAVSGCDWISLVLTELTRQAKEAGTPMPVDGDSKLYPFSLQIQVLSLALLKGKEYEALARLSVFYDGKLVGSLDHVDNETIRSDGACAALKKIASSIAAEAVDWLGEARLPECKGDCVGIHPDQPIAISAMISPADDGPGNDEDLKDVLSECGWRRYLPNSIAERYNRSSPRARIELREGPLPLDGRRLIVHATDSRVIGGGIYTGKKRLKLVGELYDGNLLVGRFVASAQDRGNLGLCWSLKNLTGEVVDEFVSQLEKPSIVQVVR